MTLSSGWLYIVDQWLGLPSNVKRELLSVASSVPQLLPTCLSLLHAEDLE